MLLGAVGKAVAVIAQKADFGNDSGAQNPQLAGLPQT
jgi:hypothetical protein